MGKRTGMNVRLGEYVRARREELGMSKRAFASLYGISEPTLLKLESGDGPPQRPAQRRALVEGLRWTPQSLESILAGGEPETLADADGEQLGELEQRLGRLEGRVEELSRLVREFLTRRR